MRQFNLKEYLENPNKKIITRDGKSVRIICTDKRDRQGYNIIALIHEKDDDICESFTIDGKYSTKKHYNDLFFAPEKHEGWVNLHKNSDNYLYVMSTVYGSKEDANFSHHNSDYMATVKIEWEE